LEIALAYAEKDNRIKVYNENDFVGVIENHNRAFRLISPKSKYCKVVSADDWIFPDCLTQLVEFAESNPSVGIVGSYKLAGKRIMCTGLEYERKVVPGAQICRETMLGGPYVFGAPTQLLYRVDLIRRSEISTRAPALRYNGVLSMAQILRLRICPPGAIVYPRPCRVADVGEHKVRGYQNCTDQ
jgi:hypothetical protein